jgi:hypothetical protein
MERRRLEAIDEEALKPRRRGWYLGSEQFKEQMLELMEGKLGESHSGELHRETPEQRANRIIAEELARRTVSFKTVVAWCSSWASTAAVMRQFTFSGAMGRRRT